MTRVYDPRSDVVDNADYNIRILSERKKKHLNHGFFFLITRHIYNTLTQVV